MTVHISDLTLSDDQEDALKTLVAAHANGQKVVSLAGAAGTGKTTIMLELSYRLKDLGWKVAYLSPTGKAAHRLKSVVGGDVLTIHRALYGSVQEGKKGQPLFGNPKAPCEPGTILICDEASMVQLRLHEDLLANLPQGCSIQYLGDHCQLPPVGGKPAVDLANQATATLQTVHRQALDNPIYAQATAIRLGGRLCRESQGDAYQWLEMGSLSDVAELAVAARTVEDSVVLSWTNKARKGINTLVRRDLGRRFLLEEGDRLLIMANNHVLKLMNGQVVSIEKIKRFTETTQCRLSRDYGVNPTTFEQNSAHCQTDAETPLLINPSLIGSEFKDFKATVRNAFGPKEDYGIRVTNKSQWVHADYGEALTVHKSQGSEFDHVFFVIDDTTRFLARKDPEMARKLTYTAVTRAKKQLTICHVAR